MKRWEKANCEQCGKELFENEGLIFCSECGYWEWEYQKKFKDALYDLALSLKIHKFLRWLERRI